MLGSSGSVVAFYVTADIAQGRSALGALIKLPALMALGCGMSPYLSKAVWQGMGGPTGEFVRTPKKGDKSAVKQRYHARTQIPWIELALALQNFIAIGVAIQTKHYLAAPFALMFAMGYTWVGGSVLRERLSFAVKPSRAAAAKVPAVAAAQEVPALEEGARPSLEPEFVPVAAMNAPARSAGDSMTA
jgi:hypothetical protein